MILYVTDTVSSTGAKTGLFPSDWGNFLTKVSEEKSNTTKAFSNTDFSKFIPVQSSNITVFQEDYKSLDFSPFVSLTFDVYIPDEKSVWFAGVVTDCRKFRSEDNFSKAVWGLGHPVSKGNMDVYHYVTSLGDTTFNIDHFSEYSHYVRHDYGFSVLEDYIGLHKYQILFCWAGWVWNGCPDYYLIVDNEVVMSHQPKIDVAIPYGIQFWSDNSNQEHNALFSNVTIEWGFAVYSTVDLQRNVQRYNVETNVTFDLQRDIIVNQTLKADLLRSVTTNSRTVADLQRDIITNIGTIVDLQRDVRTSKKVRADLERDVIEKQKVKVDFQRDVIEKQKVNIDLERDVEDIVNQLCAERPKRAKLYINTGSVSSPVWQSVYVLKDTQDTNIVFAREQWRY